MTGVGNTAGSKHFSDDDISRLRVALARINRSVERASADAGYTRSQLSVLGTVVRFKSAGMGELAEFEALNPTMLSRVVGKLEAAGLIVRTPDADDRRAVTVQATAAGKALHGRLRKRRTELFVRQLAELPPGRADQLLAALDALELLGDQMLAGTRKVTVTA